MNKQNVIDTAKNLNSSNVHIETKDGRSFTGRLNLAGEALVIGYQEYLVYAEEVQSIRIV